MAKVALDSNILTDAEVAAASDGHSHCLICYNDLTAIPRAKAPCGHNDFCGVCSLRLRYLHKDTKCPICKQEQEKLIVDYDNKKNFDDYPFWGDEIGAGFSFRDDVGMFFESKFYEQDILPLFGYCCQKCDYTAEQEAHGKHSPLRLLQDHLRKEHRLTLCNLCVDHKRDFVAKLPRFTPSQLQKHLKEGDGPLSGFFGHPVCEFCKPKRFYDLAYLHQHLHKEHYKCHICEKQGMDNQFFKNYQSLERHFDQKHFLCHDVQCLAARFMVFENELDLRAHEMTVHGGTSTGSTKINLEFRTRRAGYDGSGVDDQQTPPSEEDFNYGLDGQAFVPQALPNSGRGGTRPQNAGEVQLHPLHLQRTEEFRAQAAAMREQQAQLSQEAAFPTLQSASGTSAAPLVGWSSGSTVSRLNQRKKEAGKVTEEDFPSLGPSPSANSNSKIRASQANVGATRRQFAAMSTSASRPAQNGWNVAAVVPNSVSSAQASNFLGPPAAARPVNQQANLAPGNFPALSPSTTARPTYTAAHNLAKKMQSHPQRPSVPSLNSTSDFPAIGAPTGKKVGRNGGNGSATPSEEAMSNMLKAPPSASAKATVEDMKASLGPNKFKQLKHLTKDFAECKLSPEGYVDLSAALFDKGYADSDFWSFVPALLDSCPNGQGSEQALNYMTSLRRQQFEEKKPPASLGRAVAGNVSSSWGGGAPSISQAAIAPPRMAQPAARANQRVAPVVPGKKKSAWGGNGAAPVVRAKAPPGSVAVAAASQGPQTGSATKFMAKQAKQEAVAKTNNNGGSKKKKGKQKDELRALAFGGK